MGSCVAIAIACYCGFARASSPTDDVSGLLPATVTARRHVIDDSLFRVVIVAQRADCSSNLNHLAFLNRDSISHRIAERYVLVAGPAKDTIGLRLLLPRGLEKARISVLHRQQKQLLRQLGHHETPTLALYDSHDRLLALSATPPDPYSRTVFVRALARLITGNPTP